MQLVSQGQDRTPISGAQHARARTDPLLRLYMWLPTGTGRNSLHLALWGTVDTNSNQIAMTVGLPATTLAKAGLRGLPPGYLLPVAVSGPLHRPQVEWNAAGMLSAALTLWWEAWLSGLLDTHTSLPASGPP
jgi:hypothetical protein